MIAGISLSVSGFILQFLTNNCLADPFIIGIASGSALCTLIGLYFNVNSYLLPLMAFIGSLAISLVVIKIGDSGKSLNSPKLLLGGFAISSFCSAAITLLVMISPNSLKYAGLINYLFGSLANKSLTDTCLPGIICLLGLVLTIILAKGLRILNLGDILAMNLGLNVKFYQFIMLIIAILMCSSVTAYCGIIGFVGLIVPYVSRKIFHADERWQILGQSFLGSTLMLWADILARTLISYQDLPIGAILAILGSPFLLYLVYDNRS